MGQRQSQRDFSPHALGQFFELLAGIQSIAGDELVGLWLEFVGVETDCEPSCFRNRHPIVQQRYTRCGANSLADRQAICLAVRAKHEGAAVVGIHQSQQYLDER